ncbi:hypothetical protein [Lentilitoribacter sp. EG35]|uniref:hypothetical protein n=1 Tax=Lentilitoribacter sp. EG35 TaxID=3234192 RepID=UPI00345F95A8
MNEINAGKGDLERARDLEQWRQEPETLAEGVARYLQGDRGESVVAVFDNVDRRDTEEQLVSFQLALWFMALTRSLVILQMRDVTFERFKNEPPLDTYRSGAIFHISAPRFVEVVRRRLELSLKYLSDEAPEKITYTLSNGLSISYPKSKAGVFLNAIYSEIFQRPRNISTIIEALAGKDVRRSLDMFMNLITSGHMPEEMITNIAQGNAEYSVPEYRIIRILMRGDYRFFNDSSGFIANIFYCKNSWQRPSNFIVPEILFWLIGKRKLAGDNGQMGYFSVRHIMNELEAIGFVREDVFDACQYTLTKELVEADTLSVIELGVDDCIKATASGWIHMRILSERIEYLSSILATTPINDTAFSSQIFERMKAENRCGSQGFMQSKKLCEGLLKYLKAQKEKLELHHEYASRDKTASNYLIQKIELAIEGPQASQRQGNNGIQLDLLDQ